MWAHWIRTGKTAEVVLARVCLVGVRISSCVMAGSELGPTR